MDEDKKSDDKAIQQSVYTPKKSCRTDVIPLPRENRVQMPMPHEFNGKKYFGMADVAKIIGVTRQTVSNWNTTLYFDCPLFTADERAHDGTFLYEVERVMQLKSVYRSNWTRGSYEPNPPVDEKQTRINEAEKFFNLLFGSVHEQKFGYLWAKRGDTKKTFPFDVSNPDERKAMAVRAIELNDAGADVYYGINKNFCLPINFQRRRFLWRAMKFIWTTCISAMQSRLWKTWSVALKTFTSRRLTPKF